MRLYLIVAIALLFSITQAHDHQNHHEDHQKHNPPAIDLSNVKLEPILSERTYTSPLRGHFKKTENFSVSNLQATDQFLIRLVNADGKPHTIEKCTGNIIKKLKCLADNLIDQAYINIFRVNEAQLVLNGKKIIEADLFNKHTAKYEAFIKLKASNELKIDFEGSPKSYMSIAIYRLGKEVKDIIPPVIQASINSGIYTNQRAVNVTIDETSNVTSEIYINNGLVLSSTQKSFSFNLANGLNQIEIRSKDQYGNSAVPLVISNVTFDNIAPVLSLSSIDTTFYTNSFPKTVAIQVSSNESLKSLKVNSQDITLSANNLVNVDIQLTQAGSLTVEAIGVDLAGNSSTQSFVLTAILDNTAPIITFGLAPNTLTNQSLISIPVAITEQNDVHSQILVNGEDVLRTSAKNFNFEAELNLEGENQIQIISTDIAGNATQSSILKVIKDQIPPVLSNIQPQNNRRMDRLVFVVSGHSSEPLQEASVNGLVLTLDATKTNFSGSYIAAQNGTENLNFTVKDLAGNISQVSSSVQIDNRLLIPELVSIVPNADRVHLNIVGAAGSARSGVEISASSGLLGFNSDSTTSSSDGSFILKLSPFSLATLKAKDSQNNEEVSVQLSYQISTRLSGVVKDTQGNPLPGATISITSFNETVVTDSSGVFNINSPATGDQTLTVDGSTIPQSVTGVNRKFSSTKIQINIGLGQQNVIERPIYLAPLILDGSETTIQAGQDATVTSPQAPGVQLEIASDTAVFPSGSFEGKINIATIESGKSIVPVPQNAIPESVIALEPSGLKFKERVPVTLPNENELPPGVDMFILSMDSSKGTWSVDGHAVVSADGQTIKTKDGEGISHFSLIYAIPAKPVLAAVDNPRLSGIDISAGSLSSSVNLPSWKSLGVSITPSLVYKSNWANPTAYVSNYFDIPNQEFSISKENAASVSEIKAISDRYCEKFLGVTIRCYNTYDEYVISAEAKDTFDFKSWYQPESIRSQFFISNLTSGPIQFNDNSSLDFNNPMQNVTDAILTGPIVNGGFGSNIVNYTGIPNRSMISYAVPLKNNSTGEYLNSGIYPSLARYEVKLKKLTITSTSSYRHSSLKFYDSKFSSYNRSNTTFTSSTTKTQNVLSQVFPSDIISPLLVQNKVKSTAGRGWHLGLTQNILNPNNNIVLLEEESGELSTYSVNNTISTVFNSSNTGMQTNYNFDFSRWPKVIGIYKDGNKNNYLAEIDLSLSSPTPTNISNISQLQGQISYNAFESGECTDNSKQVSNKMYSYKTQTDLTGVIRNSNGDIYGLNAFDHSIFKIQNGAFSKIYSAISTYSSSLYINLNHYSKEQADQFCNEKFGDVCSEQILAPYNCSNVTCNQFSCTGYPKNQSNGQIGVAYGLDIPVEPYTYSLSNAGFNKPSSITIAPDGKLVVADYGNNMIRKIDMDLNVAVTIAGNGFNIDDGDGISALDAGLFHPTSIIYDKLGNLYILTESGFIRKVDSSGMIYHLGGLPPELGGVLANSAPFKQISLNKPESLTYDEVNNYLYVADTGNHRVVRFDLNTEIAETVAGSGTCNLGQVIDNTAALNSSLCSPKYIGLDPDKNLIIVDSGHNRIRKVNFNFSNTGALAFAPTAKDGSLLYRYNDGTWSRVLRNGMVNYFNSSGKQIKSVNRLGKEILFDYGSDSNLIQITDAVGQKTYLNYSGGLISSIVDPAGRTTSFNYNFGNLISINFPDGSSKLFEYDQNGLMTKETNQRGYSKKYAYNEFNRLSTVTDEINNTVQVNDVVTGSMSNSYTGGNVGSLNNQGTGPTQLHDRVVDAKSVETEITKDFNGLVSKIKDGKNQITSIERDLEGLTKKVIFPDASEVTLEYDPITRDLLKTTDTGTGISESQTYNQFGQLTSKTDGNGYTYTKQYSSNGLLDFEQAPNAQKVSYLYNSLGLPTAITTSPISGIDLTTNFEYNSIGSRSKVTLPDGKFILFQYDSAGNITQKTLQISSSLQEITKYQFDTFNRLIKVISPKNEVTEYAYLPTGLLSYIKDPLNHETFFEYNQKGLLVKKTDPDGKVYSFNYDSNNNLISETDPNGITKTYTVDAINQIIKITLPDDEFHFTYSAKGEVLVASNNTASISQNFDTKGRIAASVVTAGGSIGNYPVVPVSYSYDNNSNRKNLRSDVLNLDYFYDQSNRLRQINNGNGDSFTFDFDTANRLTKITRPGSFSTFAYNSGSILSSITHSNSNNLVEQNTYSYDQRNIPIQKRTLAGNFDYVYDQSGQLISSNTPVVNESFSYDEIGNRLTDQGGNYSYTSSRKLIEQDYNYTYTHDNNGNMIGKFSKSPSGDKFNFVYSSLNQLKEVKIYASDNTLKKTINYYFDPQGRRIKKAIIDHIDNSKSISRSYVYDGANIIAEFDGNGNRLVSYTHSPLSPDDVLEADITSNGQQAGLAQTLGKYYYLKDHLGSVDIITDSLGNTVQKYQYSAFGKIVNILDGNSNVITSSPKVSTSFTFTGREFDVETSLYFYRARVYDANTGRFLQVDPHPGLINIPNSAINKFSYCNNNPITLADHSGKDFFQELFKGIVIVVAIIAAFYGGAAVAAYFGLSGFWGAVVGAASGAAIGGIVAGVGYTALGLGTFQEGFMIGAAAGSIAGGIAGYSFSGSGSWLVTEKYKNTITEKAVSGLIEPWGQYGITFNYNLIPYLQTAESVIVGGLGSLWFGYAAISLDNGEYVKLPADIKLSF